MNGHQVDGFAIEPTDGWQGWVTPRPIKQKAIHRWYVFPHSFTDDLVYALAEEWGLDGSDHILDPFVGAGTTLVAAKHRLIPAHGCDLSPLAVLASNAKVACYSLSRLTVAWGQMRKRIEQKTHKCRVESHPPLGTA